MYNTVSVDTGKTIQACLCMSYQILYADKLIQSEDERITKERIEKAITEMYGEEIFNNLEERINDKEKK